MGWNDHYCYETERDPEDVKFEESVDEAYNIIWKLYRPEPAGCDFSSKKEESLLRIINFIDKELGR